MRRKSSCNIYFSLLIGCILLVNKNLSAQSHSPLIETEKTLTVDNITNEEILKLSKGHNFEEVLRFAPGTHHLNSREIVYDYDNPYVDKTTQKIFYDANNFPSYLQSLTVNSLGVPIEAEEKLYNGKNLQQGYIWNNYNSEKSAQLYNYDSKSYIPYTFQPTWTPMFHYTVPVSSAIQPINNTSWQQTVKDYLNKGNSSETIKTDEYGGKGDLFFKAIDKIEIEETNLYDGKGVLRKYIYNKYYPDGCEYEEVTYYDSYGNKEYFKSTWYDDDGYKIEMVDIAYKNGQPVAGWRDVDDYDVSYRQYYNPSTGNFEYINRKDWNYADFKWTAAVAKAGPVCDFPRNEIFIGGSLISEDSYQNRFNTTGFEISYTRYLCPRFGLILDDGITYGSQFNVDYTKMNLLGGVTYMPFKGMRRNDKFTLSLHALAGIATVTSKYNQSKNTNTNLAGELGVNGCYNFTQHWGLEAGIGLNPVFSKGNTSKNYRARLGLKFDF